MAAKKKSRKSAASIDTAAKLSGLSPAQVKAIDADCAKKGIKPLSFLAAMLAKMPSHMRKLETEVTKRIAMKKK